MAFYELIGNPNIIPDYHQTPKSVQRFNPYAENGGSIVAIAGEDFAVIASDTRLSTGFSIYTRNQSKLFPLSQKTVLGCSGCWCDTLTLTRILEARLKMYLHEHRKDMSTPAVAQMLSTILYYKRFFPYYVSNILAGLDGDGHGCVFSYDPIGHCERTMYRASGSAGPLLQPLLDNQIEYKNMKDAPQVPVTLERALKVIKDVFISAAERDIYTGDAVHIKIITRDNVVDETFDLRKD
uniref:Proteasome subunit beta type n=1 Tax=Nicoletia phytophila TaxID=1350298 RepID=A0A481SW16_9INSE|nr:proteasome subunit beta type [Nicoletia phytophila]